MPYRPAQRRAVTREAVIEYDGEPVSVWYRPAAVDLGFFDEISQLSAAVSTAQGGGTLAPGALVEAQRALARLLVAVVAHWDVLDEDGQEIPPSVEDALTYEPAFLWAVLNGVITAIKPGEASVVSSAAG